MKNIKRGSPLIRLAAGFLCPADNIDEAERKVLTGNEKKVKSEK